MTVPTMMTVRQVAERFRLPPSTVYRMIDRGEIEVRRFGKAVRIPVAWVERIEGCQEPTEAPTSGNRALTARGIFGATLPAEPVPSPRAKRIVELLRLP